MKASAKRIILLIMIIGVYCPTYSQSILKKLNTDKSKNGNRYMISELRKVFSEVKNTKQVIFDKSDTLYIIYGQDLTNWSGYGFVWNRSLKIKYNDQKEWRTNKLVSSKMDLEIGTYPITWYEFEGIVPIVEKWDTTLIANYVNKHDEVLGPIYSWNIYRFIKQNRNYNLDKYTIRAFGKLKNYSATKNKWVASQPLLP